MDESNLEEEVEDTFNRIEAIENSLFNIQSILEPLTTVIELHVKLHRKTEEIFVDMDNRFESMEAAMEKMLDILRAHDDLLPLQSD